LGLNKSIVDDMKKGLEYRCVSLAELSRRSEIGIGFIYYLMGGHRGHIFDGLDKLADALDCHWEIVLKTGRRTDG
jgi:hypothetical protein